MRAASRACHLCSCVAPQLGDDRFANAIVIALDIALVGARIRSDEARRAEQLQRLAQAALQPGGGLCHLRRHGLSAQGYGRHQVLRPFGQGVDPLAHQRLETHGAAECDRVLRDLMDE